MTSKYGLSGVSAILNIDKIKKDINLEELEHLEINPVENTSKNEDAHADDPDQFLNQLLDTVSDLGITVEGEQQHTANLEDVNDESDDEPAPSASAPPQPSYNFGRTPEDDIRVTNIKNIITSVEDTNSKEDHKYYMLNEIDCLRTAILLDNEHALDRIPEVYPDSSYSEVYKIFRLLNAKNNNTRGRIMVEDFFMAGAKTIEHIFNGERVFFGKYKPNLTGWSGTLKHKFYRMRHDTSELVAMVTDGHVSHPLLKMAMEIIPSAITYDAINSKKSSKKTNVYYQNAEKDLNNL